MARSSFCFLAALALTPFLHGCDLDPGVPAPTLWEADLTPTDDTSDLTGSVAAISRSGRTEAGISIANAGADVTYSWRLRSDDCGNPGTLIGGAATYPELTTSAAGSAATETVLSDALRGDGVYHAVLLRGEQPEPTIACGALVRVDG